MSEFLVCSGLLLILIGALILYSDCDNFINCLAITGIICGIFVFGFGVQESTEEKYEKKYGNLDNLIPAIEVYRGNTSLEITYRDSVAVDTVVVFKEDKK